MRSALTVICISLSLMVTAQVPDLDHLMKQRVLTCDEVSLNCFILIPKFYRENKIDSVSMVLAYWKNRCGDNEFSIRMDILLSLKEKRFSESYYGNDLFHILRRYEWSYQNNFFESFTPEHLKGTIEARKSFDIFTENIAAEIQGQYPEGSLESQICDIYANHQFERFYRSLQANQFAGTGVKNMYDREVLRADRIIDTHLAGFTGLWIPEDKLKVLGNHPVLGMSAGATRKRLTIDGTIAFGFVESKNFYVVYDKDRNRYETDDFVSVLMSVEPSYNLLSRWHRSSLFISAGFGYESITAVEGDEERNEPSVTIGSASGTLGAGYKYFFNKNRSRYIGVQGRYHIVNFSTRGGSDFDGNAFSVRLSFGGITSFRKDALERLYYGNN
jgi:hypothetical protein